MHMGTGGDGITYTIGEAAGVEEVTLTTQQIPIHNHTAIARNVAGTAATPTNAVWSSCATGEQIYSDQAPNLAMEPGIVSLTGGSQPHSNMSPYLVISFIISLFGRFPSQT